MFSTQVSARTIECYILWEKWKHSDSIHVSRLLERLTSIVCCQHRYKNVFSRLPLSETLNCSMIQTNFVLLETKIHSLLQYFDRETPHARFNFVSYPYSAFTLIVKGNADRGNHKEWYANKGVFMHIDSMCTMADFLKGWVRLNLNDIIINSDSMFKAHSSGDHSTNFYLTFFWMFDFICRYEIHYYKDSSMLSWPVSTLQSLWFVRVELLLVIDEKGAEISDDWKSKKVWCFLHVDKLHLLFAVHYEFVAANETMHFE